MPPEYVVYLVDDDEAVRDALTITLGQANFQVKTFASGPAFLQEYAPEEPGCLLLDLCMPDMDGLAVQRELAKRDIHIPIIFMTAYGTIRESVSAIKAGAFDFVEKPFPRDLLIERIRQAIHQTAHEHESYQRQCDRMARYHQLSPREREIMALIATGKSSKQIAQMLGISPRTVDAHRARLMIKMHAGSLAELGAMAALCDACMETVDVQPT